MGHINYGDEPYPWYFRVTMGIHIRVFPLIYQTVCLVQSRNLLFIHNEEHINFMVTVTKHILGIFV